MRIHFLKSVFILFLILLSTYLFSQEYPEKYLYRSYTYDNKTIPYRLFQPETDNQNQQYPLVIALHGIDDRGDDNEIQILGNRLAFAWSDSVNQTKWPCFVIAPQCPTYARWYPYNERSDEFAIWEIVINLIDSLSVEFPVDTNRLYITGLSLGGYGVWHFIAEYPDKFAAAVPICGGGDTTLVSNYLHLPIWNFHGEFDNIVPVEESRVMIRALEANGRNCLYTHCLNGECTGLSIEEIQQEIDNGAKFLYTEWDDAPHEIWDQSYDYPLLFPWVFSQSKDSEFTMVADPKKLNNKQFILSQNYPNPFNPETTIEYYLTNPGNVSLSIYNISGQRVDLLINEFLSSGKYQITWQPKGLPSGLYFYKLTVDGNSKTRKLLLNR